MTSTREIQEAQNEHWNENAGPTWVELQEPLDAQLRPIAERLVAALKPKGGEAIVDVGCGCGATTRAIADAVGDTGRVLGLDLSRPMLERARQSAAGRSNVHFVNADAAEHRFDESFDALASRFGVMFFSDPARAFSNLVSALKPGGRVSFATWQSIDRNPWMMIPLGAVAPHVELTLPADPDAPGPFSLASEERTSGLLAAAGLRDVRHDPLEGEFALGGPQSLRDAVQFLIRVGPVGHAMRENPDQAAVVTEALEKALAPFASDQGVVMRYAAWSVSGTKPG